jgi:hypothetical protein
VSGVTLLPCLFCGWEKPGIQHLDGCYNVDCPDCCGAGPIEDTRTKAIAAWNTRQSATAPLEAQIAALEARCEALAGALGEAIVWDGYDEDGVPAVWLDQADAALAQHKGDV